jgi:hypothetical protein
LQERSEITPEKIKAIPHCLTLFKVAFSVAKKASELLESVNDQNEDLLEWMDELSNCIEEIAATVDQVGSSFYEEEEETFKQSSSLCKLISLLLQLLRKNLDSSPDKDKDSKFLSLVDAKLTKTSEELNLLAKKP